MLTEYEELLGQGDNSSTSSLSTIEERANWEKQLNDLEEETQMQTQEIARLQAQLEQLQKEHEQEAARLRHENDQMAADLRSTKAMLEEALDREVKLLLKIDNMRDSPAKPPLHLPRPLSPTPKPNILPPGYSPLKSRGWAKNQRSPGSPASLSPCKSFDSTIDGVDGRAAKV